MRSVKKSYPLERARARDRDECAMHLSQNLELAEVCCLQVVEFGLHRTSYEVSSPLTVGVLTIEATSGAISSNLFLD